MNKGPEQVMVKSAARGLDVLELLAANPDGLTLSEICAALSIPKSSAHSLLGTLLGRDYLMQGKRDRTYRLGPRLFEMGSAYLRGIDLVHDGQEVIRAVAAECGETAHLAILDGQDVVYVAKEEGTSPVRMVSAVGKRFPAYGTGVGKMLLSALSPAELAQRYPLDRPLPSLTSSTITDPVALRAELARTRERGYALDREESTEGLSCVAAPVYDGSGKVVAAMSISVPSMRYTPDRQAELLALVRRGAQRLSLRLGHWDGTLEKQSE